MQSDVNSLLVQAENRYLKPEELQEFKRHASTMAQRLKIYEFLRDREAAIFEPILKQVQAGVPEERLPILEQSLQRWILILRHCAMAMLLDDADALENNLLGWLKGLVATHHSQDIETQIHQLLLARLQELLSPKAIKYLQPSLDRAKEILLTD
ncbi:phycobilisome protein [Lyngbya sp. CCY1209]|jgi:hypothetical protein|uniref:phycobilisome protein n=1 Tax=Lyngbya sp. CCY1209 TaxID=2886103 RepID=UPI002D20BF5B|nr:phycobilisome protein [Lyngbya sp. CCY1209]MEB3882902.1 phycobilisome protein [Lyngbya sp. CCY1209]